MPQNHGYRTLVGVYANILPTSHCAQVIAHCSPLTALKLATPRCQPNITLCVFNLHKFMKCFWFIGLRETSHYLDRPMISQGTMEPVQNMYATPLHLCKGTTQCDTLSLQLREVTITLVGVDERPSPKETYQVYIRVHVKKTSHNGWIGSK